MSISVKLAAVFAESVSFDADMIHVQLTDGRKISVPLDWFPKLRAASETERAGWRLIGRGIGIHWKKLEEDISVEALLRC